MARRVNGCGTMRGDAAADAPDHERTARSRSGLTVVKLPVLSAVFASKNAAKVSSSSGVLSAHSVFVFGHFQAVRRGQQGEQRGFPDKHREHLEVGKKTIKVMMATCHRLHQIHQKLQRFYSKVGSLTHFLTQNGIMLMKISRKCYKISTESDQSESPNFFSPFTTQKEQSNFPPYMWAQNV